MTPTGAPLTVGFAVASTRGPAWILETISAIARGEDARVVGLVTTGPPRTPPGDGLGRVILRLYDRIDDRVFGSPNDPSAVVDFRSTFGTIAPARGPESPGVVPDIVVRFDGRSGPVDGWPDPRLGTWTVEHGASLPASIRAQGLAMAPGGPEMLLGAPITITQIVADGVPGRRVIGQVVSRVDPLSTRRGARGHLGKLPGLVTRTVSDVRRTGELHTPIVESAVDDRPPLSLGGILGRLAGIYAGYVARLITRTLAPTRWAVAVSRGAGDPRRAEGGFTFLIAVDGLEWTDPFPVRTPDADLLFVEEYDVSAHRGRLVVAELDKSRRGWRSATTILDLPTHLSYPFVFEWSGDWYLLPEQAATGKLELYIAESFPDRWRWHSTALDAPAADATVVEIDGRWWMFAAMAVDGGIATDDLHLFHAETPLGPWTAHRGNPVVSDVRTARPAGRLYQRDGAWYRVAQDGAVTYGHSIAIIRIDRIDIDGYAETVVDIIRPDWAPGLVGTHTINSDDGLTAIDALRRKPRLRL